VLGVLAVLGAGLALGGRSAGQEPPPLTEPARAGAPAQGQPPGEPSPRTPQPRAAATDAPGQAPESAEPLSLRYRFIERYALAEDPAKPELNVQYRVGAIETFKTETERPQGAPERTERTFQTIYTERTAGVNRVGDATDAVRRYDTFRTLGTFEVPPYNPPLFQGLVLWYSLVLGKPPQVLSLTNGRPLRQVEYESIVDELFLPRLTALLPPKPARVGDTWPISRGAGKALLGPQVPEVGDYALEGRLIEVRRSARTTSLSAIIGVSGELELEQGPGAVNARIHFDFEPQAAVVPSPGSEPTAKAAPPRAGGGSDRDQGIVDARGRISRVRMGRSLSVAIPGEDRLRQIVTRELNLERRPLPLSPGAPSGGGAAPLELPESRPAANQANSWLTYDDPQGRFYFRHPQELRLAPGGLMDPNAVELIDRHSNGNSVLVVMYQTQQADPGRDRQLRDPDFHRRNLQSNWDKRGDEVVQGSSGWLKEADWAPLRRRVYRIEAALKQKGPEAATAPRVYFDFYLVLFTTNQSIAVQALTVQDPHLRFRDQVEEVIKNFTIGPSPGRGPVAGSGRPAPPSPGRAPVPGSTRPAPGGRPQ
jgi:hypothetical protein